MDDKTIEGVTKAVTELAKAVPVYQDALQPVAKQIGRSLETIGGVINVALAPVALMVHGYELIQDRLKKTLEEKLAGVEKDNIIEPPLSVVGPLLEKYRFVHNDPDLAEMFENLLANAMDIRTVRHAHPSFVQVISQLCQEEAKVIKTIAKEATLPTLRLNARKKESVPGVGMVPLLANFTLLPSKAAVSDELIYSYIVNLQRLGIIELHYDRAYTDPALYEPLADHSVVRYVKEQCDQKGCVLDIEHGMIEITAYGRSFIGAVLTKMNG